MRALHVFVLALGIGAASACSRDEPPRGLEAVEGLTKLAFEAVEGALPPPPDESRARLAIPDGLAPWRVDPGEGRVGRGADGRARLELAGEGARALRIPGPFDPRDFERVELELVARDRQHVAAYARRASGASFASRLLLVEPSSSAQRVALELPRLRRESEAFDELVLDFRGDGPVELVGGIELVHRPAALCFANAFEPDARVAIDADSRAGFALAPGRAARARGRVPPSGALRFAYGLALPARWPGAATKLRLVVRDAGGKEVERELLGESDFEQPAWRFERVPLDELAGREVEIELALDAPAGADFACAIAEPALYAPRAFAPSVLFVTSDTHRGDYLGAARSDVELRTPALDALAARGVLFEDCWSSTNVTNPSHVAMMTATSPRDTGVVDNRTPLARGARTLAECFSSAGFATFASVSAGHLEDAVSGLGQGFDRMGAPPVESEAGEAVDRLQRWLADADDAPVFCWLHVFDAHSPYEPPAGFGALYYPAERDPFDPSRPPAELPATVLPKRLHGLRDAGWPEAMYRGEISYLDSQVQRLLDAPRFRSGVVAVTADHGENLGAHGLYFVHAELYPDTLHVPLVLAYPGAPSGARIAGPVQNLDLGRTLLDLAGLASADFPGRDLASEIDAPPTDGPRFALSASRTSAAVTAGGWFLVLHLVEHTPSGGTRHYERHQVELYELASDPRCENDRVEDELERAAKLRAALVAWLAAARPLGWAGGARTDAELAARLAQLGYAGESEGAGATEVDAGCDCRWCARFRR